MAPKKSVSEKQSVASYLTDLSNGISSAFDSAPPLFIGVSLKLYGDPPGAGDWTFVAVFDGLVLLDVLWQNNTFVIEEIPINLANTQDQALVADKPLVFLLRSSGVKGARDPDPLLNQDNRAGASVDLFPLILGEDTIFIHVPLVFVTTGLGTNCSVEVHATTSEHYEADVGKVPLTITLISAHCLPYAKDGTVYLAAIGLDRIIDPVSVNFGISSSTVDAKYVVWASASKANQAANTSISVFNDDVFVPEGVVLDRNESCRNVYWNAMKRLLVDPELLRKRLLNTLFLELAGVPKSGKIDVRGRYMAFVDTEVLLQPDQLGVTTSARLLFFNESALPDHGPILELPPTSAKSTARTARDTDFVCDEYGQGAYVILRFDLVETLVPEMKKAILYETLGLMKPEGPSALVDELEVDHPPEGAVIDVRRIRKEGGALAVHKELSSLAYKGMVPMNQGIKRTAANKLLMRVRTLLKQFSPGDCSYIEWQDTVTGQHAASRRAVTSSFAPQPPPIKPIPRLATARSRIAGDNIIANSHVRWNLKHFGGHPRTLICKALRCLEEQNDLDANNYILEGLCAQPRNRFLLWIFGGQEYDKGSEASDIAAAALRLAVKGDYSDGTANAIGWAALHTLHHYNNNHHAAFVAAKRMRKSYELLREWKQFYQRWVDASGEEEVYWMPRVIATDNPFFIAAAFFLCLRCFKFSETLLNCVEKGCATIGSHHPLIIEPNADIYYLRAATLLQKQQFDNALIVTTQGIKKNGPSASMSQMYAMCLICIHGWDEKNCKAVVEAENAGAELNPKLLLKAALGSFINNPLRALQWAARAHKIAPSGQSALMIGRIYDKLGEESLAERWASAAVKTEPLLSDGWGFLALLAIYERNVDKARALLRTVKQVGPLSPDIEEEVKRAMKLSEMEALPDLLVKNLCFCDYY